MGLHGQKYLPPAVSVVKRVRIKSRCTFFAMFPGIIVEWHVSRFGAHIYTLINSLSLRQVYIDIYVVCTSVDEFLAVRGLKLQKLFVFCDGFVLPSKNVLQRV